MTHLPEVPDATTPSTPSTPASARDQEILEPIGWTQIPDFPDNLEFLNDKAILDANVFIYYAYAPHEVLSKVGDRSIHHSEDIRWELAKNSRESHTPLGNSAGRADSLLADFGSTLLPNTTDIKKIARTITHFLERAGIPSEQVDDSENDIRIMACGIAHKADIITADRLFYVMGRIFKTNIRIILLLSPSSSPPEGRVTTALNTLQNQGINTPIDILGIALNQDSA